MIVLALRTPVMCPRCWAISFVLAIALALLAIYVERRRSQRHYAKGLAYLEVLSLQRPVAGVDLVKAFDPRYVGERDAVLDRHRNGGEG